MILSTEKSNDCGMLRWWRQTSSPDLRGQVQLWFIYKFLPISLKFSSALPMPEREKEGDHDEA
jgi:hypothetical protein